MKNKKTSKWYRKDVEYEWKCTKHTYDDGKTGYRLQIVEKKLNIKNS